MGNRGPRAGAVCGGLRRCILTENLELDWGALMVSMLMMIGVGMMTKVDLNLYPA
jgi:hypothetical protein